MRKDVKLGMAIGGGLIALLVGYLLFGPDASNNKKGTQLANGPGGGSATSIIEPGDGTGSDAIGAPNPDAANQNTGSTGTGAAANGGAGGGNSANKAKPGDNPAAGKADDHSKDPNWNVLKTGTTGGPNAKANGNGPAKDTTVAGAEKPKPADKLDTSTLVESQGTPAGRIEQARLYYNPNDAYGGGISTDAVFGKNNGGERGGARAAGNRATVANALTESVDVPANGGDANNGDVESGNNAAHAAKVPTANEPGTHVVRSGETLSSIALVAYGSSSYYPHILRANPTLNPKNLKLGAVIKLPKVEEVKAAAAKEDATAGVSGADAINGAPIVKEEAKLDPTKQYRVAPRDSLYKIAMRVYGKASYVDKLYEKNKASIGPDPTRLKLGMVLTLPETPAAPAATASPASDPAKPAVESGATLDERQPK